MQTPLRRSPNRARCSGGARGRTHPSLLEVPFRCTYYRRPLPARTSPQGSGLTPRSGRHVSASSTRSSRRIAAKAGTSSATSQGWARGDGRRGRTSGRGGAGGTPARPRVLPDVPGVARPLSRPVRDLRLQGHDGALQLPERQSLRGLRRGPLRAQANPNFYKPEDGHIWHVPGFSGFGHRCPSPVGDRDDAPPAREPGNQSV